MRSLWRYAFAGVGGVLCTVAVEGWRGIVIMFAIWCIIIANDDKLWGNG